MIVIGTAGHIDHGKSSIVKRLTGTDPDRLPEEKARGMTIDLGFAFRRTATGEHLAFVDVPGHERLVKNMIAGAGGIDVVMLVVAADDGWMPQSQEHFQIVKLLGVKQGIVVINKIDLADSEWLELLRQDLKGRLAGSFLADAPVFCVSANRGDGFDALETYLDGLPAQIPARQDIRKARLFIDRSFVRTGIGGVVTGTLQGGTFSVGQPVTVWPSMALGKIRSLQSEGSDVELARPGQRTAVSLTGVDKELMVRGGVITDRTDLTFFRDHPVLALDVDILPEAAVPLEDRRRVQVLLGTTEAEGEVRIFEAEGIRPGDRGLLFFRPDQPMYALVLDRFILRLPTPMVTLGGGMVLDHLVQFPRRRELESLSYLMSRTSGVLDALILSELTKRCLVEQTNLLREASCSPNQISARVTALLEQNQIGRFGAWLFATYHISQVVNRFRMSIEKVLHDQPHLKGLPLEQLLPLSPCDAVTTLILVEYLLSTGDLVRLADRYNLAGRGMSLKGIIKEAHDQIMNTLRREPYAPPTLPSLAALGKNHQQAIKYIIESGEGYKCGSDFIFLTETWTEIIQFVKSHLSAYPKLAVTDLKDRFGFTRKFAIPILEETDRIRLTQREGDARVKGDRFEA
ncbi:MAG: selenocysteine-specific translation elongation factor [Candidatus Zixiibacteriota bacterium]